MPCGHRASACMLHAGAIMAMHAGGHALGHLGHLGHGFKLQAGASGRHALGHLGHLFFIAKVTQSMDHARALGLGLWVIWVILSSNKNWRGMRRAQHVHGLLGINPYIKIFNFHK